MQRIHSIKTGENTLIIHENDTLEELKQSTKGMIFQKIYVPNEIYIEGWLQYERILIDSISCLNGTGKRVIFSKIRPYI